MDNIIKLRKGLDIKLKGKAEQRTDIVTSDGYSALQPADFVGIVPKVVVKEGDIVKAGEALFVSKANPKVKFISPVSGTVTAVRRGERRKVLSVNVKADDIQTSVDFGKRDPKQMEGHEVVDYLLEAGLFGMIFQIPYAISANPDVLPKAIAVSALRDKPLAADFEYELKGQEEDFQTGLTALS